MYMTSWLIPSTFALLRRRSNADYHSCAPESQISTDGFPLLIRHTANLSPCAPTFHRVEDGLPCSTTSASLPLSSLPSSNVPKSHDFNYTLAHRRFWDHRLLYHRRRIFYQRWCRLRRSDRAFGGGGCTCMSSGTRRIGDRLCRSIGGYQESRVLVRLEHGLLCVGW